MKHFVAAGRFACLVPANTANAVQQKQCKKRIVMSKIKPTAPPSASGDAAPTDPPAFRNNPEVDAKIDTYIKDNPKYWAYVQAMPRDRLERTVVLNEVRELDRQQRMREGVLKQINRESRNGAGLLTFWLRTCPKTRRRASTSSNRSHRPDARSPACRASNKQKRRLSLFETAIAPRLGFPGRVHDGHALQPLGKAIPRAHTRHQQL